MNILKALEGLSSEKVGESAPLEVAQTEAKSTSTQTPAPPSAQTAEVYNVMASVIERHERISNRVRSSTQRGN